MRTIIWYGSVSLVRLPCSAPSRSLWPPGTDEGSKGSHGRNSSFGKSSQLLVLSCAITHHVRRDPVPAGLTGRAPSAASRAFTPIGPTSPPIPQGYCRLTRRVGLGPAYRRRHVGQLVRGTAPTCCLERFTRALLDRGDGLSQARGEPGPRSAGPPLALARRGPVGVQARTGRRRCLARRPLAHPGAPRTREAGTCWCRARGCERRHGTASQAPPSVYGKRSRQHPKSTWLGRLQGFTFPLALFGQFRSKGVSPLFDHSCPDGALAWPSGEIGAPSRPHQSATRATEGP